MTLKKNIVSNFLLTTSNFVFPLITFPYITRTLSNESLGSVVYTDAFTQYFIIFSALGIPLYGVREISKLKDNVEARSKLVAELLTIKIGLSIVFIIAFLTLTPLISQLEKNFDLVKLGCISILSSSFLIEWFYQGIENYRYITIRSVLVKSFSVFLILFLVNTANDSSVYYFILVAVNIINAFINFGYYIKSFHHKFEGKIEIKKHLKPLFTLFMINIVVSVYTVLDTIILGTLTDLKQVSYYSTTLKLCKIVSSVVLSIGFVLIPKLSKLYIDNKMEEIRNLMSKSFGIVSFLTIPFCFFCLFFSTEILFIISGNKYLVANNSLKILSTLPFIIGVCNILGTQFLLPIGKEKKILYAAILGLIVSLLSNFTLIPIIGYVGASITCVIAELTVCIYIILAAIKEIRLKLDYNALKLIILSLLATTGFFYILQPLLGGTYFLFICFGFYLFFFLTLNSIFFKHPLITTMLTFILKKNNG